MLSCPSRHVDRGCAQQLAWSTSSSGPPVRHWVRISAPDGGRTPRREERVAICCARVPRTLLCSSSGAGNSPGRPAAAGISAARSDLARPQARMPTCSSFGAGISPRRRRTPGREERVAICGAHRPRMTILSAFGAGSGPRRLVDAETGGARSDLARITAPITVDVGPDALSASPRRPRRVADTAACPMNVRPVPLGVSRQSSFFRGGTACQGSPQAIAKRRDEGAPLTGRPDVEGR